MEEKLNLILNELKELKKGQKNLEEGQKNLEEGQKNLEEGQKRLETRQDNLEKGQSGLKTHIINLEKKVDSNTELLLEEQSRIYNSLDKAMSTKFRSHSARLEELEYRIEKLEDSLLPQSPGK